MRGGYFGGGYNLRLTSQEMYDILECVESYCIGVTSPQTPISPDIADFYPEGTTVASPVHERFWRLHAALANRASGRKAKAQSSENGG